MNRKNAFQKSGMFSYFFLIAMLAAAFVPFLFMLTNSFAGEGEIMRRYGALLSGNSDIHTAVSFIPERITLNGYLDVFLLSPNYLMKFWNSLFLTTVIVIGQTIVAVLAGYGLAKFRFPGKNIFLFFVIILSMMPRQVTLVPGFLVLDWMGLIGSYTAVILPGIFATFGTFLLSQVFSSIPDNMLDAARIDGAGQWKIFQKIAIPYVKTGIAALIVLVFIDNWNMVEQPLLYLRDTKKYPLSVFLSFIQRDALGISFVCGILAMVPVALLFLHLKNVLIQGIEFSNLK